MQNKVNEFNKKRNCHLKPLSVPGRFLDIASELGELSKEYLKTTKYDTAPFSTSSDFELEFGDLLYSLLSLANETGINAESAIDKVLQKYQKRLDAKNNMGSGN